jgi:hypothetical protein
MTQRLLAYGFIALGLALLPAVATAQMTCADGQPCLYPPRDEGADLVFKWLPNSGYERFNVRWSRPGWQSNQEERSGNDTSFRIPGAARNTRYGFSIQGCNSPVIGRSTCSAWSSTEYVTCGADSKPCGYPALSAIQNRGGNLCLDVHADFQRSNGTPVAIWSCNNAIQQRWAVKEGTWGPIRSGAGKCLDVHFPDMRNNGGKVQVWDCNGSDQQKWSYRDGQIRSAGGKCLDVHAPDMRRNGGRVQIWDCNRTPQQQFGVARAIDW